MLVKMAYTVTMNVQHTRVRCTCACLLCVKGGLRDSAEQHVGQEGTAEVPRQEKLLGRRYICIRLQLEPVQKPYRSRRRFLPKMTNVLKHDRISVRAASYNL